MDATLGLRQKAIKGWADFTGSIRCQLFEKLHPSIGTCGAAGSALPWHGRGHRFDPDQQKQIFSKSYLLPERQLPPMECWFSAPTYFKCASFTLPTGRESRQRLDFTHNESGRDRPTERRPRCGNFGWGLNLATSCCQF